MVQQTGEVPSCAIPAVRPSRFRLLKAILPFSGGLAVGAVLALVIRAVAPSFAPPIGIEAIVATLFLLLTVAYVFVVLVMLGWFSPRSLEQRSPALSGLIGLAIPILGAGIFVISDTIDVVLSPAHWVENSMGWTEFLMPLLALCAPFLMVRWRESRPPVQSMKWRRRSVLKTIALAMMLFVITLGIGRSAAEKRFDRDCGEVASWVKRSYPVPGAHAGCVLPASQRLLTADHVVDTVVLRDGRIVLVLKTSIGWKRNWTGIIYCSGPIAASEIGTDYYGRPQIRINGVPDHFVEKQINSRHFKAGFDLN